MFRTLNPATETVVATFDADTPARIEQALADAQTAQRSWAREPLLARAAVVARIGDVLLRRKAELAGLITLEMGKPIVEAEAEIEKSALTCAFYAEHAAQYLADEAVPSNASESFVVYDPLGVVLAIMPWNYPLWQFIRFAAPALCAGNGAILKHAGNVPQCALAINSVFAEADVPTGLVASLLIEPNDVAALIDDVRIAAVTLTGSTAVGKLVASQAGRAMKKQVLELGGSDPFIVLADADVEAAAKAAVKARFSNTGQSCISSKRFIVDAAVADQFVERFCAGVAELKVGDPTDRATTIGPMARSNLRDELHSQVERTVAAGAVLKAGGQALPGKGFFYAPTVLDHVAPDMVAACEETFGPVAAVLRVEDVDAAVALANATEFGLGAALWTGDLDRAKQLVRRIEAGAVFINGLVASDARLPFGGIKQSGYGRELGAVGIREFSNIKTVWVGPAR
ncbi:NAD-dependent succinate-semialdehyde dehydrogenase [Paraburkholderia sp. BL25I1N1]|uniref:NAD-dependent succinate-semialdehyde dehydrogenase n=1 Tax=Paraburkholderia sp. BL25I1N1 TaxID=1938804 RepID=UPI000D082F22|nr:NAD-dependent succinate-semialdehyde dehydrogenase [Paraburkholderia sp. BL25I1N1]PRY04535.1 succinate-semialdehyde dehydrogenase/glutarate-semialdehyde dehydrogenase [Paraburkholderia sp. BL25I1N1]